ncbi:response regulator [Puniceicoccales bacterium CK1056]|uniref:Response regulator n=1 Tax=Oceanipulchritudo coccoides TaxID=2706888 RepID=A0A6B2LZF5_9BACT|nr:response regulator [Oceanipulchritudo coccoides]NDV61324.1 response regulator [Oceanipulchritudo coccoides]
MNKCVLIVDDDHEFSSLLRGIFEQAGYTVHTADTADHGFELLQKEPIELIVTDERLPTEMSGSDLIHKLRELDRKVPVIMVSGYLNDGAIRDLIADGVDGVFIKPLNIFSLLKKASQILESQNKRSGSDVDNSSESEAAAGGRSIGHIQGHSEKGKQFLSRAIAASAFKRNLLLIGPQGTLFEEISRDIVNISSSGERCIAFKPGEVTKESLEKPFGGDNADQPITMVILDAEQLSAEEGTLLMDLVDARGGASSSLRMIFCLSRSVEELYDAEKIDDEMYLFLGTNELVVPAIKDMPEDLLAIAKQEISERSEEAPFDAKLRSFLLDYAWPDNMLELRATIVKAISLSQPRPPQLKHFAAALNSDKGTDRLNDSRSSLERFLVQESKKYQTALNIIGDA